MPEVKSFENYMKQAARIATSLDKIEKRYKNSIAESIEELGREAVAIAKSTLKATNHTQKYGDALVDEIGGDSTNYGFIIKAPYINDTDEMRKHMYYAEYGAGVGATYAKDNIHGGAKWGYYTTKLDKSPRIYKRDIASGSSLNSFKFMRNAHGLGGRPRCANLWVGMTDRSVPARYMRAARLFIKANGAYNITKRINLIRVSL